LNTAATHILPLHRDDSDPLIFERLHLRLEIGGLCGKAVLWLVLESVVAEHDDLRFQIDRFRHGRRSGFGDFLGGRSYKNPTIRPRRPNAD
jgi:hypothetical protein